MAGIITRIPLLTSADSAEIVGTINALINSINALNISSNVAPQPRLFMEYLPSGIAAAVIAGTNTTDLAPYLQAALNENATVVLPASNLAIKSTVTLNNFNSLIGASPVRSGYSVNGTYTNIISPAGITVFGLAKYATNVTINVTIRNIAISGGLIGFDLTPAAVRPITASSNYALVNIHVTDCLFSMTGSGGACIQCSTQLERCEFKNLDFVGADYGFQLINNGNASYNYMDKCVFDQINVQAANINGFRFEAARSSGNNVFNRINLQSCGQHAFYADCAAADWVFISTDTESNGVSGPPYEATTGSINSASSSLVVASITNLAIGQQLTVAGAGANGADFYPYIGSSWNGISTTIPCTTSDLSTPLTASTSVTSLDTTNAIYDEFFFSNGVAAPQSITFIGGLLGNASASSPIRYFLNNIGGQSFALINCRWGRPVYDPNWRTISFFGRGPIRSQTNNESIQSSCPPFQIPGATTGHRQQSYLYSVNGVLNMLKPDGTFHVITVA